MGIPQRFVPFQDIPVIVVSLIKVVCSLPEVASFFVIISPSPLQIGTS
jgi:hypothetical protein